MTFGNLYRFDGQLSDELVDALRETLNPSGENKPGWICRSSTSAVLIMRSNSLDAFSSLMWGG